MQNVVAFIFARGGSKGLPGKNIRALCGKPLLAWSIEHALSVAQVRRVIVSTDDSAIASVALTHGAEVPFTRPADLASDAAPEWLAWRHALQWLERDEGQLPDVMLSVPATAPLREAEDLTRCLERFSRGDVDAVITVSEAHRNPYFNMVRLDGQGYARIVNAPDNQVSRRQDAPDVFDIATVAYAVNPRLVLEQSRLFDGRIATVELPPQRCVDIDTLEDFEWAEFLLGRRHSMGKTQEHT
jgi:CMP-N-acetylneuraminic acid synthetase